MSLPHLAAEDIYVVYVELVRKAADYCPLLTIAKILLWLSNRVFSSAKIVHVKVPNGKGSAPSAKSGTRSSKALFPW